MKPGGNAYRLFEVLKEREEHASPKTHEPPDEAVKKFVPVEPDTAKHRPTLLLGGIDEKKRPAPRHVAGAPVASVSTVKVEEKPARPPQQQPGRTVLGHYRGKALVMKYDVAMVVVLAMMCLLVIAFVWGHAAGKSDGIRRERARLGALSAAAPPQEQKPVEEAPKPSAKRLDDGEGIYRLQLVTSIRTGIEAKEQELNAKGYPHVAKEQDAGSSKWVLYLGLFRTRQSAEEYQKYLIAEEKDFKDSIIVPRP
jgi:hypothetical protein